MKQKNKHSLDNYTCSRLVWEVEVWRLYFPLEDSEGINSAYHGMNLSIAFLIVTHYVLLCVFIFVGNCENPSFLHKKTIFWKDDSSMEQQGKSELKENEVVNSKSGQEHEHQGQEQHENEKKHESDHKQEEHHHDNHNAKGNGHEQQENHVHGDHGHNHKPQRITTRPSENHANGYRSHEGHEQDNHDHEHKKHGHKPQRIPTYPSTSHANGVKWTNL